MEMTSCDVIMGTLSYMSPEQKVSSTNVDQTTDIYAIGVILYEILVGKKPLGHFKLPSELVPNLHKGFDTMILKCLAQEPMDRYQQAVELKDAILDIIKHNESRDRSNEFAVNGSDSFMGKCRYLDTIKETSFSSTILVENRISKQLYVIKKHSRGEVGRKEAKLLSSVKHKNIIDIFGSGGDRKSTVIITEYAQGGSLADRMVRNYNWEKAFKIILSDDRVKSIFVNIFGGILRCDVLAEGVVGAAKEMGIEVPLIVRLEGTNVDIGRDILAKSGLKIHSAADMGEGARMAVELAKA